MKKLLSIFLALAFTMSALPAPAETKERETVQSKTYSMNLDWKFFETGTDKDINTAMSVADRDGKKFYETDYDDSQWQSVSIPHAIDADNSFIYSIGDAGDGNKRGVFLYRKTFTVPAEAKGGKVFFEIEGIRQAAYVWVNGEKLGYYEAGITAFGFDLTNYVTAGEKAVIAICEDATAARGTSGRIPYETVPGEEWGSSYTPNNYKTSVGRGTAFQWNAKDFNEVQAGLVYNAYLHIKPMVYQTLPLYNNLKTTGNYIYATDFDIEGRSAVIGVKAEIRNESGADGAYSLLVEVADKDGSVVCSFESGKTTVPAAKDKGTVYETAVEKDVYDEDKLSSPVGITRVNTPDVTYITASAKAEELRFWSLDDPYLYTVRTVLVDENGARVDEAETQTGFRKVTYDLEDGGLKINDKSVWLKGYAQRSTNEWAVIGTATDWLTDYDMQLLRDNNANFIRWMHVAPKPAEVRSSDRYGIAVVCPAGDKEGEAQGRQWSQRAEAMRDAIIYFRNSPSVLFWETGNSAVSANKAAEMNALRLELDPYGMRFIGARSTRDDKNQLNYEGNFAGTMYGRYASDAKRLMSENGIYGPIVETEYARDEAPRRVWDDFSPPDFDYVNKYLGDGAKKKDGFDIWDLTQEQITVNNVKEYSGYFYDRVGSGNNYYTAAAMMVWSDSNMHGRNSGSENCRTSGRVDPVRQTKEMYFGTRSAQSPSPAVHIVGHWSYPALSEDTYNYFDKTYNGTFWEYNDTVLKRDPKNKTVYVIGSPHIARVELYSLDGTLLGSNDKPEGHLVYSFAGVDVTAGEGVKAKAYDKDGNLVAEDEILRTYEAASLRLTPTTAPDGWRADGADIAFFDVEVLDKNGNVCPLNYDRIDISGEGEGVLLGGYNSGTGGGCFPNTEASKGISSYFGGEKANSTTMGKSFVYAENGTNRIFVRSSRTEGEYSLTVSMNGLGSATAKIASRHVAENGGVTLEMPDRLEAVILAHEGEESSFTADAADEGTAYINVTLNGEPFETAPRVRLGINNVAFGPAVQLIGALKELGAPINYFYDMYNGRPTLALYTPEHAYYFVEGENRLFEDGFEAANSELTEDMPTIEDGVMIAQLNSVLEKIPGVAVKTDHAGKEFRITFAD